MIIVETYNGKELPKVGCNPYGDGNKSQVSLKQIDLR